MKKRALWGVIFIMEIVGFNLDAHGETIIYCGDLGYSALDMNKDCKVNMADLAEFTKLWLVCTDPSQPGCTDRWRNYDVTFFITSDIHFNCEDPDGTYGTTQDRMSQLRALNQVSSQSSSKTWPAYINGVPTGFPGAGQSIAEPMGLFMAGDITNYGGGYPPSWPFIPLYGPELSNFENFFQHDSLTSEHIRYPVYVGVGNHDIYAYSDNPFETGLYRRQMWGYVDARHCGSSAPVQVVNFDNDSHSYSVNFDRVHVIQTHCYAGCTLWNQTSGMAWLINDLAQFAAEDQPVFIIQHYRPYEDDIPADVTAGFLNAIAGYNIVGIFNGHWHTPEFKVWQGYPVFGINNAASDCDGNGSFGIVRITRDYMNFMTCRWTDDQGHTEFVAPYYNRRFH